MYNRVFPKVRAHKRDTDVRQARAQKSQQRPIRLSALAALGVTAGVAVAAVLGGSWYLLTNHNCAFNCTYDHIRALKGLKSGI